ncbi:MAG: HDIG domain-containing protein [Chloroflexaceae bacterium]|nr:HDIG domain-containing protein [Chloroflexaceae bacterium]
MQRPWWLLNTFHRPYQNGSWPLNRIHMVVLVGALLAVAFWMALILRPDDGRGRIEVGRPSPISIQAERSVSFVSDLLTEQARATAENSPENIVYRTDQNLLIEQQDQLNDMLRTISNIRNDPSLNSVEKREELVNLPTSSVIISDTLADAILNLNDSVWSTVQRQTRLLFTQALDAYDAEIDDAALRELRTEQLPRWVAGLPQLQRDLVLLLTNSFLRVNHVLDEEATERQKLAAREAVTPVVVDVQAGESIVRVGEIVTPRTIEILEATDTLPDQLSMFNTLGLGIIAAMLSFTTILHISFYHREIAAHPRQLLVIVGLLIITALAGRLLFSSWEAPPYTFPLAAVVLAITIVFNSQLALVCAVVLSIMVGLMQGDNQLPTAVTMLLGSGVAVVLARGAERPGTLLIAGAGTTVATVLSQIGFTISTSIDWQPVVLVPMMTFSLVNGVLSALLAWGMFYVVATLAGIITAPQLMELSHPSRPLLRKLMREAPGTYYHSISVANLAEAAAEAVAADALLLRVAAFYHDIGKTIRPYFFTDNQTGRENVHNELDPQISAAIIIDHVREGVKMARAAARRASSTLSPPTTVRIWWPIFTSLRCVSKIPSILRTSATPARSLSLVSRAF